MNDGVVPILIVCAGWAWAGGATMLSMATSAATRTGGVFMTWPPGGREAGIIAREIDRRHPYTRRRHGRRDGNLVRARRHRRTARGPADARTRGAHAADDAALPRHARGGGAAQLRTRHRGEARGERGDGGMSPGVFPRAARRGGGRLRSAVQPARPVGYHQRHLTP